MNISHTNASGNSDAAGDTADAARDYALAEIDGRILPGWPAHLIRKRPRKVPGDWRDRALADQIINGIVKNVLFLQECIAHHSGKKLRDVDVLIQKILAIGLYQLKFLDRIPLWAAVSQAVEQTRRFGRSRAAGFVNSVLRNALRQPPLALPDPQGYAAIALSHPPPAF